MDCWMSNNMIPNLWASGKYVALPPFDQIVKDGVFYTAEAVRTIPEMQAEKEDLFKLVWQPVQLTQEQYQTALETAIAERAAIVTLTSRGQGPIHIPSTFFKSFPMVDGVVYERLAIIADLGACPPAMKDRVNNAIDHFNNWIKANLGISTPSTVLGTVPTRSYVSKQTAEDWERSRQLQISEEPSDAVRLNLLSKENLELKEYIRQLEATVQELSTP
jgi:hypothetical protein